jgi:hypothetical protein
MIFVYIRIYRAATKQTNAFRTGQKKTVGSSDGSTAITLRIHRGGYHKVDTQILPSVTTPSPVATSLLNNNNNNKKVENLNNKRNSLGIIRSFESQKKKSFFNFFYFLKR